jgi:hypothetical protein
MCYHIATIAKLSIANVLSLSLPLLSSAVVVAIIVSMCLSLSFFTVVVVVVPMCMSFSFFTVVVVVTPC